MAIVIPRMCVNPTHWYNAGTLCRALPCPDKLFILCDALDGAWFSSRQSDTRYATASCDCVNACGGSCDSYVTFDASIGTAGLGIDVWRAYDDGLWTSSVSFDVYRRSGTLFRASALNLAQFGPHMTSTVVGVKSSGGTGACDDTVKTGTVTLYDDGTVTAA